MTSLVVVAPIQEGMREEARRLLEQGPPFDLELTEFDRHTVFVTSREVVFVFEAAGEAVLRVPGEDPALWRAATEWRRVLAGAPRVAANAFRWSRPADGDDVSWASTPGPGDSEGGDLFPP
jgi:hypothetical protein